MRRGVVAAGAAGGGLVGDVVVVVAGREAVMGAGAVVVLRVCVRVAEMLRLKYQGTKRNTN